MPNDYYDHLNIDGDERPLRDPDAQEQLFYALFKYPAIAYCNAMFRPELDANNNLFLMPDSTDVGTFSFTADAAVVIITFERTLDIYYNKGNKIGFTENNERYMYPIYVNQNQSSAGYIYAGGTFLLIWHRTGTLASGKPDGYFLIGDLQDARGVPYDNAQSILQADNVNDAIDELDLIKANAASLATVATSGDYRDLSNKPTIPAAQVNSDWNASSGVAEILNKPTIPTAASDISYDTTTTGMGAGDVQSALDNEYSLIDAVAVQTINLGHNKQDKLTAGSNINIAADNTISATDTKPSDYNGQTTASGTAVAHGTTWQTLLSANITAGKWLVSWAASFASSGGTNTGYRGAGVATTGDPFAYMAAQVPAVPFNTYTLVSGCALHVATGNQTLNLKVRQYSTPGASLTVTPRLQVIKIL